MRHSNYDKRPEIEIVLKFFVILRKLCLFAENAENDEIDKAQKLLKKYAMGQWRMEDPEFSIYETNKGKRNSILNIPFVDSKVKQKRFFRREPNSKMDNRSILNIPFVDSRDATTTVERLRRKLSIFKTPSRNPNDEKKEEENNLEVPAGMAP